MIKKIDQSTEKDKKIMTIKDYEIQPIGMM
jgi:hypothetical protein